MNSKLNKSIPIFLQIREMIINDIINEELKEGGQIYSENELTQFYGINRSTVRQGLQLLVDDDLVFKKRGVGIFVQQNARIRLVSQRKNDYKNDYILPLIDEAKRLGIDYQTLKELIEQEKYEC